MNKNKKKVLKIIESNTCIKINKTDLDIDLFECGYIDSFDVINLICDINEKFRLNISPAEYSKDKINTIRKISGIFMAEIERNANNTNY